MLFFIFVLTLIDMMKIVLILFVQPLRLHNVDENVANEIDDVLLKESDKEEILRKVRQSIE